jgi:CPA2 family monovalent cation:H+ antiporter-2
MVAMKSEVLGVGGLQVLLTTAAVGAAAWGFGATLPVAIVLGGAVAMSSTAIVMRQLGDQLELGRTHSRLALGIVLFQDLAFAPLLALATSIANADDVLSAGWLVGMVVRAVLALLIVLAAGRWLLRPLFHEFARHRSTEIFTLTVLFVVLAGAWATHALGLSMAIGAFLAGMLLAETEFRYQTEAVIKPFPGHSARALLRLRRNDARSAAPGDPAAACLLLLRGAARRQGGDRGRDRARLSSTTPGRRFAPGSRCAWVANSASRS